MAPRKTAKTDRDAVVGTFKKIAPPRISEPRRARAASSDVVEAMRAMIEKGRAREIAATLPDLMAVSASLGDVTAQALQIFVLKAAEKPDEMSIEDAKFIFDVHRGTVEGVTKAYEVVVSSPAIPAHVADENGHLLHGQVMPPSPPRRTKLFSALEAVSAAIDVTPKE